VDREDEETRRRNVLRIEVEGAAAKRVADVERAASDRAADHAREEEAFKSEVSIPPASTTVGDGDDYDDLDDEDDDVDEAAAERERVQRRKARLPNCSGSQGNSFCLSRYRSVRDHNGRYYLVVKVL
jgi:tRNA(Ile)-lysidine synthase TilS/MesJ